MGRVREQSQGAVLSPDTHGPQAVADRDACMGANDRHRGAILPAQAGGRAMRFLRRWWRRMSVALSGRCDEDRLQQEVDAHIALLTDEFVRSGMPVGEARRQAILKFGAVEAVKEEYREQASM